ncbi:MAG: hypothetical protein V4547_16200 [Bacteroidota bacterium]
MTQADILKREPNMERASGYSSYYFTCIRYGKKVRIHTHDSQFWDEWKDVEWKSRRYFGMARRIIGKFIN